MRIVLLLASGLFVYSEAGMAACTESFAQSCLLRESKKPNEERGGIGPYEFCSAYACGESKYPTPKTSDFDLGQATVYPDVIDSIDDDIDFLRARQLSDPIAANKDLRYCSFLKSNPLEIVECMRVRAKQ